MSIAQDGWRTLAEETPARPPRMDFIRKLHADGALMDDELDILSAHYGEPCTQCTHPRDSHQLYNEPGDEESWSFCRDCGGRCAFVTTSALRFEGEGS